MLISSYLIGGNEKKLLNILKGLDKNLFEISVFMVFPAYKFHDPGRKKRAEFKQYFDIEGIAYHEYTMRLMFSPFIILRIIKAFKSKNVDIVLFFATGIATFLGPICGRLAGIKTIIRSSDTILDGLYPKIFKGLDQYLIQYTDLIWVPSRFLKKLMIQSMSITAEKFVVIPNAIDLSLFELPADSDNLRSQLKIPKDHVIIVMVANLIPIKNHELVIRAFPKILDQFPDTWLVIVGEGVLHDSLNSLARELNVAHRIQFPGHRQDVPAILHESDIGLSCSKMETHGISIIEMMAAGLPVVAPETGGIPEIIHNQVNGFLFPPENSKAMTECLCHLLISRKLRETVGSSAQKYVRNTFGMHQMMDHFQKMLTDAAHG